MIKLLLNNYNFKYVKDSKFYSLQYSNLKYSKFYSNNY